MPSDLKEKLINLSSIDKFKAGYIEFLVLYGENTIKVKVAVGNLDGEFEDLGYGFGIITFKISDADNITKVEGISYFELPQTLYINSLEGNKASCVNGLWDLYDLSGKGVLIGFIDSGIDYRHPAFMDTEGNTRIEYIYDIFLKKGWNREEINQAINSQNPYDLIAHRDFVGHGTHVAGIASGGGNIDKVYYGAAYNSSIAMIKITPPGNLNYTQASQIMRAIKILLDKRVELNMPLVINLSFSTNNGAHNGSSILEQYISTISNIEPISFVIAAGNEGEAAHHVGGTFRDSQNISINIAQEEKSIIIQLYKEILSDISIEITSPSGKTTGKNTVVQGSTENNVDSNKAIIYYTGPRPFDINGEIIISILALEGKSLIEGTWNINITLENDYRGRYDMWLPISEALNPKTKFLQPSITNTLGIPATVSNVVSVGSYNYSTMNISGFSGRGKDVIGETKPDLVAPGENIISASPGGGYDSKTGTSMATPFVSGIAALLMEWGIIDGNDSLLFGQRLKYFLLKGARRNRTTLVYPNYRFGYGEVCGKSSLDLATSLRGEEGFIMESLRLDCGSLYLNPDYNSYLVEYDGDIVKSLENISDICAFVLDESFAVISVKSDMENKILKGITNIVYKEDTSLYTLSEVSPIEAADIPQFHNHPYLPLDGYGVLVGTIDTGIDYLNKEFMYEDDTTRINYIWDQTLTNGSKPLGFSYGVEFNKEEINQAIKAMENGENPYKIVPSKDDIGHGTSMAGILGGRGRNPELKGAAPGCEFAVVKLKPAIGLDLSKDTSGKDRVAYNNTDVIMAIKYLSQLASRLNKPLVIYISVGTNAGAHDGNSIIERYIDEVSRIRGVVVVSGTGNQGDEDLHASGMFQNTGEVKTLEVKISKQQRNLAFEIWIDKPDKVSIGVISPSGEVIEKVPAKLKKGEEIELVFEGSKVFIEYYFPEELTGDELIRVKIEDVREGIWQFKLFGDYIVSGRYNAWLPQRDLLKGDTRFLTPNQFITLMVPSTSRSIITTSYYNQNNNSYVASSGRGYTRDDRIKPDLTTGGINVKTTKVGGGETIVSGSSAATAVLAGACALLFQWGVVEGKDPTIYAPKMKTYLIRGTKKRPGDKYPNPEFGYGMLSLQGLFENIRSIYFEDTNKVQNKDFIESKLGDLFIRMPLNK
ncbi:S8 family serine peptidase [Clostridium algidicarnis]|uniref:S8 family serine peptidase n=1 Tax=Clostridium algidicarnis TaxID=37659 RepID=UPI001C0E8ECA|nr:S8 family serine peptidase [Clostridium algidicarnis]MBU3206599.1 S8 family serine peptidase [Clostridium algidicarnis]